LNEPSSSSSSSSLSHQLIDAKLLPCGETICSKCVTENTISNELLGESFIECKFCNEKHKIKEIFPNKLVNEMIKQEISKQNSHKTKQQPITSGTNLNNQFKSDTNNTEDALSNKDFKLLSKLANDLKSKQDL
jgi:hypothetical protein